MIILVLNKKGEGTFSPSPFYSGTYHPPVFQQQKAAFYFYISKIEKTMPF